MAVGWNRYYRTLLVQGLKILYPTLEFGAARVGSEEERAADHDPLETVGLTFFGYPYAAG